MTLDGLMSGAALECIDTRERHLAIYTVGMNGYVCKNEAAMDESRALFKGVYRDCQTWIERQGNSAALKYVVEHMNEVPALNVLDNTGVVLEENWVRSTDQALEERFGTLSAARFAIET